MFSLTVNESRVVNFLVRNWSERISINEVAKRLKLSPMGAYKILRKLEKQKVLFFEQIGQAKYYKINFKEQLSRKTAEFVLSQHDFNSFANVCAEDLKKVQEFADCIILFGSVLTKGIEANDIDIFCVIKKQNYEKLRKEVQKLQKTSSKHIQLVVQTFEDLVKNLKNKDPVLLEIIRKGAFILGQEVIFEGIKECQQ